MRSRRPHGAGGFFAPPRSLGEPSTPGPDASAPGSATLPLREFAGLFDNRKPPPRHHRRAAPPRTHFREDPPHRPDDFRRRIRRHHHLRHPSLRRKPALTWSQGQAIRLHPDTQDRHPAERKTGNRQRLHESTGGVHSPTAIKLKIPSEWQKENPSLTGHESVGQSSNKSPFRRRGLELSGSSTGRNSRGIHTVVGRRGGGELRERARLPDRPIGQGEPSQPARP